MFCNLWKLSDEPLTPKSLNSSRGGCSLRNERRLSYPPPALARSPLARALSLSLSLSPSLSISTQETKLGAAEAAEESASRRTFIAKSLSGEWRRAKERKKGRSKHLARYIFQYGRGRLLKFQFSRNLLKVRRKTGTCWKVSSLRSVQSNVSFFMKTSFRQC